MPSGRDRMMACLNHRAESGLRRDLCIPGDVLKDQPHHVSFDYCRDEQVIQGAGDLGILVLKNYGALIGPEFCGSCRRYNGAI